MMKIFYHVQDETEMATCKYIMTLNSPVSLWKALPESVEEIQVSLSNNVLLISGTYDMKKGYETQFYPEFPITGLVVRGTKIVYFMNLPDAYMTDGVKMAGVEMDGV